MSDLKNPQFIQSLKEMEFEILLSLSFLEKGFGTRKWRIAKETGIPEDILTVLLKRLKAAGKIELIRIFSEDTLLADGSGYCLAGKMN